MIPTLVPPLGFTITSVPFCTTLKLSRVLVKWREVEEKIKKPGAGRSGRRLKQEDKGGVKETLLSTCEKYVKEWELPGVQERSSQGQKGQVTLQRDSFSLQFTLAVNVCQRTAGYEWVVRWARALNVHCLGEKQLN